MTSPEIPLALRVDDIAKILGIGKNTAYTLIHNGSIKCIRIGRQIRIPRSALLEYLNTAKS